MLSCKIDWVMAAEVPQNPSCLVTPTHIIPAWNEILMVSSESHVITACTAHHLCPCILPDVHKLSLEVWVSKGTSGLLNGPILDDRPTWELDVFEKIIAHVSRSSYMNAVCLLWIKESFIYLAYKDLDFKIWLACALGAHSFTCQSWKVLPLKTSSASCHNALPWTVNATQNGKKLSIHLTWITCSNVHHFQDWVTYPKRHAATSMPTCIMYNQQIAEIQYAGHKDCIVFVTYHN